MGVRLLDAVVAAVAARGGEAGLGEIVGFLEALRSRGLLDYRLCELEQVLALAAAAGAIEWGGGRVRLRAPLSGGYAELARWLAREAGRV